MIFLEPRPGVKVTVTRKQYGALCHPNVYPHTRMWQYAITRCIHTPNIVFLPQTIYRICSDTIFLEPRPGVKVTVTPKQYVTLRDPKVYQHIKYGIPTSNNIRDILRTRFGQTDGQFKKLYAPKVNFEL